MIVEFGSLVGKTLKSIHVQRDDDKEYDLIVFTTFGDVEYHMKHYQECCEEVYIDDIAGDIRDLCLSPILLAEEVKSGLPDGSNNEYDKSYTWTFYKLATVKGAVTIKWYGTSNGYYSEEVELFRVVPVRP